MSQTLSLAEVKAHLSELVGKVSRQHDRVTVTVHGHPSAVLVSLDDLEALEETIAVLSDKDAVRQMTSSQTENSRQGRARPKSPWPKPCDSVDPSRDGEALRAHHRADNTPTTRRTTPRISSIRRIRTHCWATIGQPASNRQALIAPLDDCHSARRGTYRVIGLPLRHVRSGDQITANARC